MYKDLSIIELLEIYVRTHDNQAYEESLAELASRIKAMTIDEIIQILDGLGWESQHDLGAFFLKAVCMARKDFSPDKAHSYLKEKISASMTMYTSAVEGVIIAHPKTSLELLRKLADDKCAFYRENAAVAFMQHSDCTLEILIEHRPPSSEYYQERIWKEEVAKKLEAMSLDQLELHADEKKYQRITLQTTGELGKRYKFMVLKAGHGELITHLLKIKSKRAKRLGAHQLGMMCSDSESIKKAAASLGKAKLTCEFFTGCICADNLSPQLAKELLETEKDKYAQDILKHAAAKES